MLNVKVKVYSGVKYDLSSEKVTEVEYKDIQGFEIVTGEKATEIENMTDVKSRDDYNEYLVITFKDGQTATFRNSYVDLFRI